ncbi:MAG: nucleoside triphosphate pyrophosphohydrolase [Brevefilum sp.]
MNHEQQTGKGPGITLLGLGPGEPGMLTREATDWLEQINTLVLRTNQHPTVKTLPEHLKLISFDAIYEQHESFEKVYNEIIARVLEMGRNSEGVTYAVPGHPFVAEATCPEILKQAEAEGIPVRVIHGLSFLEPTFCALGIDPLPEMVLIDAMQFGISQTPGFPPSSPALVAQIYSRDVASDVKLTLMAAYPDEHPVTLIHGAGTKTEIVEDLPLHAIDRSSHLGLLSSLFVHPLSSTSSFESFQEIIAKLRAPGGCPWDREQTHQSLRPFLLEETYEALDALDREDMTDLQEELGDLLLQIVLHTQIATENADFNIHDVIEGVGSKLIRRHPHVFSEVKVSGVSGVIRNWEAIKAEERGENGTSTKEGLLDGVPRALPALSQAQEIIERVGRVDFDLLSEQGKLEIIQQKLGVLAEAKQSEKEQVIGELLLATVALAYHHAVDAESALRARLSNFLERFSWMEKQVAAGGKEVRELNPDEQQQLWQQFRGKRGREEKA